MPKQRDPNRDRAKELYISHSGNIALTSLAAELGVPVGSVRGWKAKDKWDSLIGTHGMGRSNNGMERSDNKKGRSDNGNRGNKAKSGSGATERPRQKKNAETNTQSPKARPGNKNAAGNKGGDGATPGNKYALTTGEYESIEFSHITDETEAALLAEPFDKYAEQMKLIKTERIRRYRMMKRIEAAEAAPGGMVIDSVIKTTGISKGKTEDTTQTIADSSDKRVLQIEDALSRIIAGTQRGITNWHKMENDDAKQSREVSDDLLSDWLWGVDDGQGEATGVF